MSRVLHLLHRAHQARDKVQAKMEKTTEKVVRTLELGVAAAAGGIIQGKAGPDGAHVMGVPVDLGIGLGLNLLGLFDVAGKHSDHLNNLGDGFLAAYLSQAGFGIGSKWRTTGKLLGGTASTTTSGALGRDDMAQIAAQTFANMQAQAQPQSVPVPLGG